MKVWAIVVAAGAGSRFGRPKQFEPLAGRRVVDWSVAAARAVAAGVVLVVPAGTPDPDSLAGGPGAEPVDAAVAGGATRSDSVRAGLAAVPGDVDVVVVHDAARPLAGPDLFRRVVAAVEAGADCAIPAVAVSDTIKRVAGDTVTDTLPRDGLVTVQTPQAFRAASLRRAHSGGAVATDDASLVESLGGRVVVVPGEPRNLKLTHPHDLTVAAALLGAATPAS